VANAKVLNALLQKMNPRVAELLGLSQQGVNLMVGKVGQGNAAETSGADITFGRKYLKRASRKDVKGALTHELFHSYAGTAGASTYGASGDQEVRADAARYALTGNSGGQWDVSSKSRRYAQKQGWLGGGGNGGNDMGNNNRGVQGNGPSHGNSNRNRNTLRNLQSKSSTSTGQAPPPSLSPSQAGAYASQVAALQQQLAGAMAQQRLGISQAKGTFIAAKGGAREQRIADTAGAVNSSLSRGIFGSSMDLAGRTGAITTEASTVEAANLAKSQAVAQARLGGVQATGDYYSGLAGIQTERANTLAEIAAQNYQNDLFDTKQQNFNDIRRNILQRMLANQQGNGGNNGNGGNGGGGGYGGYDPLANGPAGTTTGPWVPSPIRGNAF
jgi:hypothetical protein